MSLRETEVRSDDKQADDEPDGNCPKAALDFEASSMVDPDPETTSKSKRQLISVRSVPRLLFSKRWWWTTILVLLGMAVMVRLGIWQLDRLNQRKDENKLLVQQLDAAPVELTGQSLPEEVEELIDRLAIVEGEFDYDEEVILTQQRYQSRLGVHLITPLKIKGSDKAVLVDRGWIPAPEDADGSLLEYRESTIATVEGVISESETISGDGSNSDLPISTWYRVDIEAIEKQVPYDLLPIYLKWLPGELDIDPPIRAEREVDLSEGSHLSYAIQWFSFTILLGIGYGAFIIRSENQREFS